MTGDFEYIGSEAKYLVTLSSPGFSMADDQFEIILKRGSNELTFAKSDLVLRNGNYYLCFDTTELGIGDVVAIVKAHVPDADFPDGFRTEVFKVELTKIRRV